ncbi:HCP-like protein [Backusella circina FSU 941]|nr:HCP-like protein [Backusella circina FSU 941]
MPKADTFELSPALNNQTINASLLLLTHMPSIFARKGKSEKISSDFNDQGIFLSQQEITNIINGDAATLHKIGDIYFKRQKYSEALKWYKKSASKNYPDSLNEIGWMYRNGLGVAKDYDKAIEYYLRAEQNGSSMAQTNLGYMYCNGLEVPKNYQIAMQWYQKAATNGNEHAQNNIGYLYEHGLGVSQDYSAAMKWYMKAGINGSVPAQNNIGRCYQNGLGVPKDINVAIEWFLKADGSGYTSAAYNLGWIYEFENEVRNKQKAIDWYRKCANKGHKDAKSRLVIVLRKDFSIKIEPKGKEKMEYRWDIEEMSLEPSPLADTTLKEKTPEPSPLADTKLEEEVKIKAKNNSDKMRDLEEKMAKLMATTCEDDPRNDLYYDEEE